MQKKRGLAHRKGQKMIIRPETEKDYHAVENLTREAFWNRYRPGCTEHFILHNLRGDACFVPELDYLIEENGIIVAHIAYAKGELALDTGGRTEQLLFGPVSVLPSYQNRGFGSRLIRFTLNRAAELGFPSVVITGSPEYYRRFGFEPASRYGIFYAGADRTEERPYFLVKILDPQAAEALRGCYTDPACYFVDGAAAEEFDRSFPPKIKERLPGQLE